MSTPALSGIHHLKVHVTDVRRSARWYQRTLGYEPVMEFVEGAELVGYGMSHPNGRLSRVPLNFGGGPIDHQAALTV